MVDAKVMHEGEIVEVGISIDEGRIIKIGKIPSLPKASQTMDLQGKLALPGLIDMHVHLRDLELAYKEDFKTGTFAAIAGGFTTVFDMPNTKPPTTSTVRLLEKIERAKGQIAANVGFYAAFPEKLKEIANMAKWAFAFKVYLPNSITELDVRDDEVLRGAFRRVDAEDRFVIVHAEDALRIEELRRRYGRRPDIEAYLKVYDSTVEGKAVKRIVSIAEGVGARAHIAHVTTREALRTLSEAKEKLPITCEATPHHLLLTENDLRKVGGFALTRPPLRPVEDVRELWRALGEGLIDVIASDHAPHTLAEKLGEDVWKIEPGIPNLETTLPLMLTKVREGYLSLWRLVEVLAKKPASILKLKRKGDLARGFDADITVVDLKSKFLIDSSAFWSKAKYSPFDGAEVSGRVAKVLIAGELAFDDGEAVAKPGSARVLTPN